MPPKVRYHTTTYVEENQRMFKSGVGTYAVENVVKVLNGTLESVLHLIGYSFFQIREINRLHSIAYLTQQNVEFDLSFLETQISDEIMKARPSRAHLVEYENRLYGVVVDEGRARICGQINRIIPKTVSDGQSSVMSRGIKISRSFPGGQSLNCEDELRKHLESGQNLVIVSEKGAVFLVPNHNLSEHQYQNDLTLVLGIYPKFNQIFY